MPLLGLEKASQIMGNREAVILREVLASAARPFCAATTSGRRVCDETPMVPPEKPSKYAELNPNHLAVRIEYRTTAAAWAVGAS